MSEGRRSKRTSFKCVDEDMEVLPESLADTECGLSTMLRLTVMTIKNSTVVQSWGLIT